MTKEDAWALAQYVYSQHPRDAKPEPQILLTPTELERFAELVAKHEREQCLAIADQCSDAEMHASMAANAIRARGTNESL